MKKVSNVVFLLGLTLGSQKLAYCETQCYTNRVQYDAASANWNTCVERCVESYGGIADARSWCENQCAPQPIYCSTSDGFDNITSRTDIQNYDTIRPPLLPVRTVTPSQSDDPR